MTGKNIFYAQSGGVTSVINASACGVIETARSLPGLGKVYAGRNGILGALREELFDTSQASAEQITGLKSTPGGAFGSCRYKLKSLQQNAAEYQRLIEVFKAHDIGYFFYNGGGDSQDTAHKVSQIGEQMGYPLQCIGIPKTIDNDLPFTDHCPGFGSVAKYVAISTFEAALDVASMCETSTKVFVLEVMGRHTGWIAAASGLAKRAVDDAPHIILFPEVAFNEAVFLERVQQAVARVGYCVVVVSEGVKNTAGEFLADAGAVDAFGHKQLGGVAPYIAGLVQRQLGLKHHWAVADYLQRSARHVSSQTDVDHAYALGKAAVELAVQGKSGLMPIIVREQDSPYRWRIDSVALSTVANVEKHLPAEFIGEDGCSITDAARRYLAPLIAGEAYPEYQDGLPQYIQLNLPLVAKRLPAWNK